ncbi:hypothetical protein ABT024_06955 [Streptomyces sp. NPDC002812]|uniref:hypothetical protein n=1 Tax=Streptomyces sp. NPDC002812 TaxID=3154434 RepID=UPI003331F05C
MGHRTQHPTQPDSPAQRRQLDHVLAALATASPGRRRYIAEAAQEYLDQIDGRRLPVWSSRPILDDHCNRGDAFRMRRGCTVAAMLGLAVRPTDPNLPATARAIIDVVNTPVDQLVQAAHNTGAPAVVALVHLLAGAR